MIAGLHAAAEADELTARHDRVDDAEHQEREVGGEALGVRRDPADQSRALALGAQRVAGYEADGGSDESAATEPPRERPALVQVAQVADRRLGIVGSAIRRLAERERVPVADNGVQLLGHLPNETGETLLVRGHRGEAHGEACTSGRWASCVPP